MDHLQYLGLMLACLVVTLPLEVLVGARVWRQPVRTAKAIGPAFVAFVAWDLWATRRGMWGFDDRYTIGVRLPGGMVVEELLFFLVVPICALMTLEAVRALAGRRRPEPVAAGRPTTGPA
jgi:lycopene cyclase domain-containing protein